MGKGQQNHAALWLHANLLETLPLIAFAFLTTLEATAISSKDLELRRECQNIVLFSRCLQRSLGSISFVCLPRQLEFPANLPSHVAEAAPILHVSGEPTARL